MTRPDGEGEDPRVVTYRKKVEDCSRELLTAVAEEARMLTGRDHLNESLESTDEQRYRASVAYRASQVSRESATLNLIRTHVEFLR